MITRPRRRTAALLAATVAVAVAFGLIWFQPWKLWIDQRVDEPLPAVALAAAATPESASSSVPVTSPRPVASSVPVAPPRPSPGQPVLLSSGRFISHEHPTSGAASVVQQPGGSRVLAIAGLRTSNGPDLHVWLTDAPVRPGSDGWHIFDDGTYLSLGTLKGNLGNQTYPIPPSADLTRLTSVTIWCARFDVSFGAAALRAG